MTDLLPEVGRFRTWAQTIPLDRRLGEWELGYDEWESLYGAIFEFFANRPFSTWTADEKTAVVYVIARDNEAELVVSELHKQFPATCVNVTAFAVQSNEWSAKWQLADRLGYLVDMSSEAMRLLLVLADDENEYVRRRSLQSLARLGYPGTEALAVAEWEKCNDNQEWARMNVLWCLHRIGSPKLTPMLAAAEVDNREYLADFARRVRKGNNDDV